MTSRLMTGVCLAALLFVGAFLVSGLGAPPARAVVGCYATFLYETGNYKDNNCKEETADLEGEYVLAELIFKKVGRVWCAMLGVFTGEYQSGACSIAESNGLYTRVVTGAGKEETEILPESAVKRAITATIHSSTSKLEAKGGLAVNCKSDTGTATTKSYDEGTFEVHFSECTATLGVKCTSSGSETGVILIKGTLHYWYDKEKTSAAYVYLLKPANFTCGTVKSEVTGCVAGPITEREKLVKVLTNTLKQTKGVNEVTKVLPAGSGSEIECKLEVSTSGGPKEQAGLETTETFEGFKQEGKAIEVLLMD